MYNKNRGNDKEEYHDCEGQQWLPQKGQEMRTCFTKKKPKLNCEGKRGRSF